MQSEGRGDGDRDDIIDAAYSCLSEPHRGHVSVGAILQRAGVSSRAFYRHFASKDELFLAMLRQETDALANRLDRIAAEAAGSPADQLAAWVREMFNLIYDPQSRLHLSIIDSEEVRAAKGYRETRERAHADRERSLVLILRRGRDDGSFPLTDPEADAVSISAVVSRIMLSQTPDDEHALQRAQARILDFALRALGARRPSA